MLSKKTKGLFVEVNGFSYLVAGVTGLTPPFSIESIDEFPRNEPGKLKEFLEQATRNREALMYWEYLKNISPTAFFTIACNVPTCDGAVVNRELCLTRVGELLIMRFGLISAVIKKDLSL